MPAPHAPLQRCFIYGIHPQSTTPCGVGTPAPSCWGSAAPAQTVGDYRDFQEQTNGDEHRWPLQHQVSQILVSCKCFRACPQRTFIVHWILTGFTLWVAASFLSSLLLPCTQMHGGALSLLRCRVKQLHLRMLLVSVISRWLFYIGTLPCNNQFLVKIDTEFEVNILQVSGT